jgi:hypothetical protein
MRTPSSSGRRWRTAEGSTAQHWYEGGQWGQFCFSGSPKWGLRSSMVDKVLRYQVLIKLMILLRTSMGDSAPK